VYEEGLSGGLLAVNRFLKFRYKHILNFFLRWNFERKYGQGIDIIEEDWDNLIILDACRYDIFKQHTRFEGELKKVVSAGYNSWSFQSANFVNRDLSDTIYITANPFSPRIPEKTFFKMISLLEDWNVEVGATLPQAVNSKALEMMVEYPNKRLIIHYMQPHDPHIGDYEHEFEQEGRDGPNKRKEGITVFEATRTGVINHEELRKSYIANLEYVEAEIESLIKKLPGKTVITADHGENLGDRVFGIRFYSHRFHTPQCRLVPWLELDYESRKKIIPDDPVADVRPGQNTIDRRLRDLGYL
jgi:hypothetical protein